MEHHIGRINENISLKFRYAVRDVDEFQFGGLRESLLTDVRESFWPFYTLEVGAVGKCTWPDVRYAVRNHDIGIFPFIV